jgi:hypothetical protein
VIWNINRQISFSLGTALLLMLYSVLQQFFPTQAYPLIFMIAAILGSLPLFILHQLKV